MNRQKREEAIRAGVLQDKRKHEPHSERPEDRDHVRGGPTADPNRPPRPEHQPVTEQSSESRR
jgi:hypothetical protein